jgi:hypothetical protein
LAACSSTTPPIAGDGGGDATVEHEVGADADASATPDADAGSGADAEAGANLDASAGSDARQDADTVAQADAEAGVDSDAPAPTSDAAGPDLPTPLLRSDPEPPGAHCPNGGTAVHVGLDLDRNGVLEDSEITSTTYVCEALPVGGALMGSIVVRNSLDVALLNLFTSVTGDVDIESAAVPTMAFPHLTSIGGTLTSNATGLTSLELPALRTAGSVRIAGDDVLAHVGLDALATVEGGISIGLSPPAPVASFTLPSLTAASSLSLGVQSGTTVSPVSLPQLVTVTGPVSVTAASLEAPLLELATRLEVTGVAGAVSAPRLKGSYSLPGYPGVINVTITGTSDGTAAVNLHALDTGCLELTNVGTLELSSLAHTGAAPGCWFALRGVGLSSLVLPALVDGSIRVINGDSPPCLVCGVQPIPNTLTSVSAPLFATGDVFIDYDDKLTSISLPALSTVPSVFEITNDGVLTHLDAPLLTAAPTFRVRDNAMLPACLVSAMAARISPPPMTLETSGNSTTATCP